MIRANIRHLLIPVGNDWSETFTFYEQVEVACSASKSTTQTAIKVKPLPIALSPGNVLRKDACFQLEVALSATQGAESVTVTSIPDKLPKGTVLRSQPENLTNCTAEFRIWKSDLTAPTATPSTPFTQTATLISPATNGQWLLSLDDATTSTIAPNCVWSDLPTDLQSESSYQPAVWRSRYYWQLNVTNTVSGTRTRRAEGAVFASKEKL